MPSLARDPEIGDVRYQGDTSSKVPYILEYIMGYSCKVSLSSGTYETKGEIRITRNANYYRIQDRSHSTLAARLAAWPMPPCHPLMMSDE